MRTNRGYLDAFIKMAYSFFIMAFLFELYNAYGMGIVVTPIFIGVGVLIFITLLYVLFFRNIIAKSLLSGKINPTRSGIIWLIFSTMFEISVFLGIILPQLPGVLIIIQSILAAPIIISLIEQLKADEHLYDPKKGSETLTLNHVNLTGFLGLFSGILIFRFIIMDFILIGVGELILYAIVFSIGIFMNIIQVIRNRRSKEQENFMKSMSEDYSQTILRIDYHLIFISMLYPVIIILLSINRVKPEMMKIWLSTLIGFIAMVAGVLVSLFLIIDRVNSKKHRVGLFIVKYAAMAESCLLLILMITFYKVNNEQPDVIISLLTYIFKVAVEFFIPIATIPLSTSFIFKKRDRLSITVINILLWLLFFVFLVGGLFAFSNWDSYLLITYSVLIILFIFISGGIGGIKSLRILKLSHHPEHHVWWRQRPHLEGLGWKNPWENENNTKTLGEKEIPKISETK